MAAARVARPGATTTSRRSATWPGRFFEKECAPNEQRWGEQQHVDREVWRKAGELGLLCPSIPTEYGGGGGTFAHEAVIAEEQVRRLAPSLGTSVHSTIVAHYINSYGTEEQKQRWLPEAGHPASWSAPSR